MTRPLLGLPNPAEELLLLEEKANATYGVYKEKLDTKAKLLEENVVIEEGKKALLKQMESEQGNVSQYQHIWKTICCASYASYSLHTISPSPVS